MSTKAQREREARRTAGLTNGGACLWIADHDGQLEVYSLLVEGDVVRLVNEDAVEYVCSPRGCSCPAYAYSKRGSGGCKHVQRLREVGLMPTLAASTRLVRVSPSGVWQGQGEPDCQ